MRLSSGKRDGRGELVFDWASFDLERLVVGDCVSFMRFRRAERF